MGVSWREKIIENEKKDVPRNYLHRMRRYPPPQPQEIPKKTALLEFPDGRLRVEESECVEGRPLALGVAQNGQRA